jgi:hypothetical protein
MSSTQKRGELRSSLMTRCVNASANVQSVSHVLIQTLPSQTFAAACAADVRPRGFSSTLPNADVGLPTPASRRICRGHRAFPADRYRPLRLPDTLPPDLRAAQRRGASPVCRQIAPDRIVIRCGTAPAESSVQWCRPTGDQRAERRAISEW